MPIKEQIIREAQDAYYKDSIIEELSEKYNLPIRTISKIIYEHINSLPNVQKHHHCRYFKLYYNFYSFGAFNEKKLDSRCILIYYNEIASASEKKRFKAKAIIILDYIKTLKPESIIDYITKLGIDEVLLYTLAKTFKKEDRNLLRYIINIFKSFYDFYKEHDCIAKNCEKEARIHQISPTEYANFAKLYSQVVLGEKIAKKPFVPPTNIDYEYQSNFKELYEEFQNSSKSLSEFVKANNISYYAFKKYIQENFLKSYLNSPLDYRQFALAHGMIGCSITQYVSYCKDEDIYQQTLAKIKRERENKINRLEELAQAIMDTTSERPFDLIDYYLCFRDIEIQHDYGFCAKYVSNIASILNTFFAPLMRASLNTHDNLLNMYIEISGYVLTFEEKEEILKFLESNNIPLFDIIFQQATRRYIKNTLPISIQQNKN